MARKNGKTRGFIMYPNFHFRDQNPLATHAIAEVKRAGIEDKDIYAESGVALTTMRNLRTKKTRDPRCSTVERILRTIHKSLHIGGWNGRK